MPKQYDMGGRATRGRAAGAARGHFAELPPKQSLRERLAALRNVPPYLRSIWQTSRRLSVATIALRLLRALLPVVTLYVGKLIVDEVARFVQAGGHADLSASFANGELHRLWWLLGLEFALAVIADILGRIVSLVDSLLGELYTNATSVRLMEHAASLDLEDFEDADLQDRLDRARRQVAMRNALMSQLLGQAQDVVTIVSFAIGLLVYTPWLILLLFVALVPVFVSELHFNAESYAVNYQWTPERRELDYLRMVGASATMAKEVKSFGLSAFLVERYKTLSQAIYRANRSIALRRAGWGGVFTTVGTVGYYSAYALIAWRTVNGTFTIGDLTFLSASFRRLRGLLEGLLYGFSNVAGQALYLDDLFSFFEIEPEIVSPENPLPFPHPIREGFVFENVGFRYPGAERWAVRNLDFALGAGEVIALVGENGAGKTTIVKLLARLYEPDEGRILLDGRDLREYALEDLRANIGVIFQDFVRYYFTASDNIAVGRIEGRGDAGRIAAAAQSGLADGVIAKLPKGYAQMLGKLFRDGVELSGGEWQKIAIARAYMRDAQLLILDEPTAALDARSEFAVFQRFKDLAERKSAVIISHRFSTVRMADRIVVLEHGRIIEAGTHEELLARQGHYAELFELQAAGIVEHASRAHSMTAPLAFSEEVRRARADARPLVALESTIITHGMPYPQNVETARRVEAQVRAAGAVPATIAVMAGHIRIGLSDDELETLGRAREVMKLSRADLAVCLASGRTGATTVAATMIAAALAGIDVFATGGIGGVHRGAESSFDISADLHELAQTRVTVVSAGAKAILDLAKTLEVLETLGVPVIAVGQQEFPAFWSRSSGLAAPLRMDGAGEIAAAHLMRARLRLPGGQLVANPIPHEAEIPRELIVPAIEEALADAARQGIAAKAVTPFLLQRLFELTQGRSLGANIALVLDNARLAAQIAAEIVRQRQAEA